MSILAKLIFKITVFFLTLTSNAFYDIDVIINYVVRFIVNSVVELLQIETINKMVT